MAKRGKQIDASQLTTGRLPGASQLPALTTDKVWKGVGGVPTESDPGGTPSAHASTHENGGADEISVAGLSGTLADAQTPSAHKTSHQSGGSDEPDVSDLVGAGDVIVKAANETVNNSATLQNDDHLLKALGANEEWVFELLLLIGQGNDVDAGFNCDFAIPSGASGWYSFIGHNGDSALIGRVRGALSDDSNNAILANHWCFVFIKGYIAVGATPGNLQFRWAQYNAKAVDTTVSASSFLKLTRLA